VRIANREEAAAFVAFLEPRSDVVVGNAFPALALARTEASAGELEVEVVASLNEQAMRLELELLVGAWRAARRAEGKDATVALL
jgi:hypothetical protein